MPQGQVRVLPLRDFSGGINYRDDAFQLAPNESPDLLNVDLLPQGGVGRRKTIESFNATPLAGPFRNVFGIGSLNQVVVQLGNVIAWSDAAGVFTQLSASAPLDQIVSGKMRGVVAGRTTGPSANAEALYLARNAEQTVVVWSGSGSTVRELTDPSVGAWNEDVTVPVGGRCPKAACLAWTNTFMFAANIREGSTLYKNRVRWSHPGEPEDWRANDFVDVDPNDGDQIVGLVAYRDSVLVFKRRSVHLISGYSPETFQLSKLAPDLGAVSQEAISVGPGGVAFFDDERGVYLYDGQFKWLWPKIAPKLEDATIIPAYRAGATVCWMGPRLYVSVPWEEGSVNGRTFVYDARIPSLNWTAHDYGLGPMLNWNPLDGLNRHLACSVSLGYLVELEVADTGNDSLSGVGFPFESYFVTAWLDGGSPGVKKRWRRPKLVLSNDQSYPVSVLAWKDYDLARTPNSGTVQVTGASDVTVQFVTTGTPGSYDAAEAYDAAGPYDSSSMSATVIDATPGIYNVSFYGQSYFSGDFVGSNTIKAGPTLGRAMAVRMKFTGSDSIGWRLDAVQIPYVMGRVK